MLKGSKLSKVPKMYVSLAGDLSLNFVQLRPWCTMNISLVASYALCYEMRHISMYGALMRGTIVQWM